MDACLKDLDKPKYVIFTLCGTIIGNFSIERRWREELSKTTVITSLLKALDLSKDRSLRMSVLRALQNLCFDDKTEESFLKHQPNKKEFSLGKLLLSKSAKLRVASAKTLRNCSSTATSAVYIEHFVSTIVKATTEATSTEHRTDLLIVLKNYLRNSVSSFTKEMVPSLCQLFKEVKETKFHEMLLFCLVEVSKIDPMRLDVFKSIQKLLIENLDSKNLKICIYSSMILYECSKEGTFINFYFFLF